MVLQKTAVVVGIGPGAGSSIARRFAHEGYKVALVSRREESLQPVAKEIESSGGQALSVPADTGDAASVRQAFQTIVAKLGAPEVLVYNAGPGMKWPPPGILDLDPAVFSCAFDAGVTGALMWAQQALPAMVEAGRGTILFTGATAGMRGGPKFALLACPKFALRALSQSIAREFQPQGIHVAHIIIDGIIEAPRTKGMMPDREQSSFMSPDAIAETYWQLHKQDKSAWTQEMDLRPFVEKF